MSDAPASPVTGLLAVFATDRAVPVDAGDLDDLAACYELVNGGRRRETLTAPHAQVVVIGEDSPVVRSGESWAAAAGVVHTSVPLAEARPEQLDGPFALVAYDAAADELTVATDPFAMQSLYVAERGGRTYVSTAALPLARHLGAARSDLGTLTFLRTGYQLGPVTHWDGIERLEPGTCLTFGRSGVVRRTYWRPEVDDSVTRRGFESAVEHAVDVLNATYATLLGGRETTWADLTGGFDTRLMGLVLDRAGVDFATNTVGDDGDPDVRIARAVAGLAGWRWIQLSLPDAWERIFPAFFPLAVAWSDGRLEALQLAQVLWGHAQKSLEQTSLLLGGGHEHFRGHTWQQEFLRAGRSKQVNFDNLLDMRWMAQPVNTSMLQRDPSPEIRADLAARARTWAAPYAGEPNTVQLDVLHAHRMVGHFGAFATAGGAFLHVQVPAYFKPVFTTAFSTSFRHRLNHRLMRHMIRRLDPRIAALATTAGGPAEPWRAANLHRFVPYFAKIGRRAVTKLSRRAIGRGLLAARPPTDRRVLAARHGALRSLGLRHAEMLTADLYRGPQLDAFLERALRPGFEDANMLTRIVTLELALRAATPGHAVPDANESREAALRLLVSPP
jgi:hypothetical protein